MVKGMHVLVSDGGGLTVRNVWLDHCLANDVLALCICSVLGEPGSQPAWPPAAPLRTSPLRLPVCRPAARMAWLAVPWQG